MRDRVDFTEAVPARCAQMLAKAEVEVALVPVIEYQRAHAVSLVPEVCVGSIGEVRSVLLVSRKSQLESIRSVALDESSRTSATLVKIIFREFLGRDAEWTTRSPRLNEMLERNDAALIIGDPAMVFTPGDLKIWDMASLWRNYTGLGFVFAMWMLNDSVMDRVRRIDFAAAADEGVENKPEIISEYQRVLGLSRDSLQDYLDKNICFRLDNQMQQGLNLYYELAYKHGLIEAIKPLRMLEPLVEASL